MNKPSIKSYQIKKTDYKPESVKRTPKDLELN